MAAIKNIYWFIGKVSDKLADDFTFEWRHYEKI